MAGLFEPWAGDLTVLAREPNAVCKISGVATEADHHRWSADDLIRYVSHSVECFGFDRVMFGGDWPVSERAIRYADWVNLVDRACAGVSAAELKKLYRGNAVAFYRL